jgi:spermidine synthase
MRWYFGLFVVSGFCSILYEVIWLRSAMAQFGVTTAIVSLVLSSFMIGLGLGSYLSGYIVRTYGERFRFSALRLYALTELLIGISAVTVPLQLFWGREILRKVFGEMSSSSFAYYLPAGVWIAATLVPWCACMGATFPFAMAAIRQRSGPDGQRSFSYLYLANVLGAVTGATVPLLLIELFGFRRTLLVGAGLNFLLAACAFCLTLGERETGVVGIGEEKVPSTVGVSALGDAKLLWLLFGTGLTSMGAEVVWVRIYTPSLGTFVYAFAAILAIYLVGTYVGSWIYRRTPRTWALDNGLLWLVFGVLVLFAFVTADPRLHVPGILRVVLGIAPFAGMAGFITPLILDRFSAGHPGRAGTAYAINIAGCVLGPLVAGFLLLPALGERLALGLLALPWLIAGVRMQLAPSLSFPGRLRASSAFSLILVIGSIALAVGAKGYEEQFFPRRVRRDSTATVVATGSGRYKKLLVNGVGMTSLSPVTKMMAHLPLAFLARPPQKALVVCFGMGTSELAMLSWGIHSTVVELVPSVPLLVTFFHPDANRVLLPPLAMVVVDDGRSYLEGPSEQYDVIIIDPPPPVEAAGSSLLYSKEFYAIAKRHLREGGILQQWLPSGGDGATAASVARALAESFPYVRVFTSVEGVGMHFLASMNPIPPLSAADLAKRLSPDAARDLIEWGPASSPTAQFEMVLSHERSLSSIIQEDSSTPALRDDRPINEYFLLRRLRDPVFERKVWQFLWGN